MVKPDYFYELYVKHGDWNGEPFGYYVYYRSKVDLPWEDVPIYAVRSGDLIDSDFYNVESVMEITPEEYFAKMWE